MKDRVAIVLVNYNGKEYNDNCIQSLLKTTLKDNLKIIVVDNKSSDGSLEDLQKVWGNDDRIHIISLDDNYGFSKANNEGIKWALENEFSYIMLLNNDTEVEPDTIEQMLLLQKETGAIIVPKVLYADSPDKIWCAGGEFSKVIKKASHCGLNCKDEEQFQTNRECSFANGCCVLFTDQIIAKTGLLDERFFLYYEDVEYSMRAAEAGVKIFYCGQAVVYHKVNGSTKGNDNPMCAYYITRNWLLCNKLHLKENFGLFFIYFILNRLCWCGIWLLNGKISLVKAVFRGINDYRIGKTGRI